VETSRCPSADVLAGRYWKKYRQTWRRRRNSRTEEGHFTTWKGKLKKAIGFAGAFGAMKGKGCKLRCESSFDMRMLECRGCKCHGDALVKVDTKHTLKSASRNCKLWFLYADLMVRNMANKYRMEANAAKLSSCFGKL